MTTRTSSTPPQEPDSTPTHPDRIGLSGPGDLIAALPGLMGFVPEESLVLILLGGSSGREVVATMRLDLPPVLQKPHVFEPLAERLHDMYQEESPFDLMLVLIDAAWDGERGAPEACHTYLLGELAQYLSAGPIDFRGAFVTASVTGGARWAELPDGERSGLVPDPRASDVNASHVLQGRTIHASRADLEAMLRPGPPAERDELFHEIGRCAGRVLTERLIGGGDARAREFADVMRAMELVQAGELPDRRLLARSALAIACSEIRDVLLGLAIGRCAGPAQELWALLARRLDGVLRAEAATLFAVCAYASGDGASVGVAVDAALSAAPGHGLATLLDEALEQGTHPTKIREILCRAAESSSGIDPMPSAYASEDALQPGISSNRSDGEHPY